MPVRLRDPGDELPAFTGPLGIADEKIVEYKAKLDAARREEGTEVEQAVLERYLNQWLDFRLEFS